MSTLSSQADPPTLKNLDFVSVEALFLKNQGLKNQGLGSEDALDGVSGLLGLVLGAFGGFLEAPSVLLRVRGGTLDFQNFLFGLP